MTDAAQAWLLISVDENESAYAGNDGYIDLPSVSYSWDSQVPNCSRLRVGDFIAIWNKTSGLLGTSIIEKIEVGQGMKSMFRCPYCNKTEIRKRVQTHDYACDKCKKTFERPVVERREVTTYKSSHGRHWIDSRGVLKPEELRPLALVPTTQHSMRLMDARRFLFAYRKRTSKEAAAAIAATIKRSEEFGLQAAPTGSRDLATITPLLRAVDRTALYDEAIRLQEALLRLRRGGVDHQAPHKPLLVLYLLNRYWQLGQTDFTYESAEDVLIELLEAVAATPSPNLPWWRLQNDGDFWTIDFADELTVDAAGDVSPKQLRDPRYIGRWSHWAIRAMRTSGAAILFEEVAATFFTTEQQDIITAILAGDVETVDS